MFQRSLFDTIIHDVLNYNKIIILYGPRQAGKTTLIRQVLSEIATSENDLRPWFRFFLAATVDTCERSIQALRSITALKKDCELMRLPSLGRKMPNAQVLLDRLFTNPIIQADEVAALLGVSLVSSYKLIDDFQRLGIIKEMTGYRRNRVFIFREYLDLFER